MKVIAAALAGALLGATAPASGQEGMEKLAEGLLDQAQEEGVVRVIVTTGSTEEAVPVNAAAAQVQVMNSLAPAHVNLAQPLGDTQVLMEVTEEGLRALGTSPLVLRVQPDKLDAPQSGGGLDAPQSGGAVEEPSAAGAEMPRVGHGGLDAPLDDADAEGD